jgi:hypothetical protein
MKAKLHMLTLFQGTSEAQKSRSVIQARTQIRVKEKDTRHADLNQWTCWSLEGQEKDLVWVRSLRPISVRAWEKYARVLLKVSANLRERC